MYVGHVSLHTARCLVVVVFALLASGCGGGQPPAESRSPTAKPESSQTLPGTESAQTTPQAPPRPGGPGRVTGFVFQDSNRNGRFDANDTPAAQQNVALTGPNGAPEIQSVTTGADGRFQFDNVPAGKYRVTLKKQEGFERTSDDSFVITVTADAAVPEVRFGIATAGR